MMRILGKAWKRWLRFAEILGNVQMVVILSLLYWTFVLLLALPFRLVADPLALRRPGRARWISRDPISSILESMRRQG